MSFRESIAEETRRLAIKAQGTVFWLKKNLTSSDITVAGVDITEASTGGELAIEDIVIKADSNGLWTTGTTLRIISDNSKGTVAVMAELASNLGSAEMTTLTQARARRTLTSGLTGSGMYIDLFSETKDAPNVPTILESGKKLSAAMVGAANVGVGTIDVYVKFRRLADDADVLVAS